MIRRIWHGWTTPANADAYERLLRERILPGIVARGIAGLHGLEAWRHQVGEEIEFVTVMSFDDLQAVAEFTGGDPGRSVVPGAARRLLARFDEHSQHYDLVAAAPFEAPRAPESTDNVGR
ncbi:antibiotic biosynthesis monooxygenase [Streptomyces abyssalis]|uniref:Antibiotic biosynthesis monooxygenase n=1 Tax=Streptomyces abyssalis TaxID=933944 RepID=A0A1E7JGN3_9ACTN|nr:antibiotic biosynthesis monooxygenase [Streptomyces abyssalis]OEU85610.1 antibiotic biosynthesis monooxygenase [Streptomyces abyssalis]OEU92926.1 antibiotic biosynthesis monooxygenase [Streptomyces abyssalis]OEV29050.1 antibiotic biosynthesis monooxygenase [Streptomyces nanshensis]